MGVWPAAPDSVAPVMILAGGRFGVGVNIAAGQAVQNSGALIASTAHLYPLTIPERVLVYKLFWAVAVDVASSTIDVGIYTSEYERVVSTGSTAVATGSPVLQEVDITDTVLDRGNYYLAVAGGATPPNLSRNAQGTLQPLAGIARHAGFPLPATVTPVLPANAFISVAGLACRTLAA